MITLSQRARFVNISISTMIKFFLVNIFAICSLCAVAQSSRYIQKLYAYREVQRGAGNLTSDTTHGNASGSYTNYLIYVEIPKSDTPLWNSAVIGNDIYSVHPTLIEQSPMVIGERKRDNRLIKIKPDPGNSLWKLEFDQTGEKERSATSTAEETVVLKGLFKNRNISSTVRNIVELAFP